MSRRRGGRRDRGREHGLEIGGDDLVEVVRLALVVPDDLAFGPDQLPGARCVVLNADDSRLRVRAPGLESQLAWFGLDEKELLEQRRGCGETIFVLEGDDLVIHDENGRQELLAVDRVPIALGGAARYNVANALAAIAAANALGLDRAAILAGLQQFAASPEDNPGRLNQLEVGGVRLFVDYAHNPHGVEALLRMVDSLAKRRWLVVVGQAGDRDDGSIRELARSVWGHRPDRVIVKELSHYLRGRELGEVPGLIAGELRHLGAQEAQLDFAASEVEATEKALGWAEAGDVVLLLSQEDRAGVLELGRERRTPPPLSQVASNQGQVLACELLAPRVVAAGGSLDHRPDGRVGVGGIVAGGSHELGSKVILAEKCAKND